MSQSRKSWIALTAVAASALVALAGTARAAVIISEVSPWSSGNSPYQADWFELTNTGAAAVDIAGWKMDDNSFNIANAVGLRGVASLAPGQSAVFVESVAASDPTAALIDAVVQGDFIDFWFGGSAPAGFAIGAYGGSGTGLGTGGDGVVIFDASDVEVTRVSFGSSTSGFTFDNAAGINGAISQLSAVGVNGAFQVANEVGSPGTIGGVIPEPASFALAGLGALAFAALRRRK